MPSEQKPQFYSVVYILCSVTGCSLYFSVSRLMRRYWQYVFLKFFIKSYLCIIERLPCTTLGNEIYSYPQSNLNYTWKYTKSIILGK